VDDPYQYGQIAAANALSDIYAMGGEPKTALSILGFPAKDIDSSVVTAILQGGLDKLTEAGVVLLGGHSVRDDEIKFGYAVTGTIDIHHIKQNSGAHSGDRLILTKPLGIGLITTAIKRGTALPEHVQAAVAVMVELNRRAAELGREFRVHSMTDITGFGLLGHASEVARASHISIQIDHTKLPLLPGALMYSRQGFCAAGLASNEQFFGKRVRFSEAVPPEVRNVLFDPQTSGGLLMFCHPEDSEALVAKLQMAAIAAVEIGTTGAEADPLLTVF
jgi:selenide,water dikinase